jgi:alpha-glucuronidase
MKSGKTLWDEMCLKYQEGVTTVEGYRKYWETFRGRLTVSSMKHVRQLLAIQQKRQGGGRMPVFFTFRHFRGCLPRRGKSPCITWNITGA